MVSANCAARSISSGVKGGYGGSPGRLTNSSTPMVSFPDRSGVARSVIVLKPTALSAPDQKDPSALTSLTAIGCPVEKTSPAIPFPGGQRIFTTLASKSLTASRNLNPPSLPSRTSTDASAEPTESAATWRISSMACLSGADKEFEISIAATFSLTCSACVASPPFPRFVSVGLLLSDMCNLTSHEDTGGATPQVTNSASPFEQLTIKTGPAKTHYTFGGLEFKLQLATSQETNL